MSASKKSVFIFGGLLTLACLAGAGYLYMAHYGGSLRDVVNLPSRFGGSSPTASGPPKASSDSAPSGILSSTDPADRGTAGRSLESPPPPPPADSAANEKAPATPDREVPPLQSFEPVGELAGSESKTAAEAEEANGGGTESKTTAEAEEASGGGTAGTEPADAAPGPSVIVYGRGKALTPNSHAVAGDVPADTPAVNLRTLYEGKNAGEDSIVRMEFIDNMAAFLAENYWPAGTHPLARTHSVSTAGVKWANLKYGAQLQGFNVNKHTPSTARSRVLEYVLMPSMINGLYNLYAERFITALNNKASKQIRSRGGKEFPPAASDIADMYGLYASKMRSVAGAARSYYSSPKNAEGVAGLIQAEETASVAGQKFNEALIDKADSSRTARAYQIAVMRREQAREAVASSLRMGGSTQGLDTDSLVYIAMWLHRRSHAEESAMNTLVGVLDRCADRFEQERDRLARPQ